jgi:hypothetical protein
VLFRYRLILAKAKVLSRTIKFLKKLEEKLEQLEKPGDDECQLPFKLKNIESSHERISEDVKGDCELINDTLEMALILCNIFELTRSFTIAFPLGMQNNPPGRVRTLSIFLLWRRYFSL